MEMSRKLHSESNSDRISELPESIRAHILSFLETKDAVRNSILSSSWRGVPTWLPNLDLNSFYLHRSVMDDYLPDFDKDGDDASRVKRELIIRTREGFYAFLDRVFGSSSGLEKVKLCVPGFRNDMNSRVDHWLDGAVRRGVKELELKIGGQRGPRYVFPESVLTANSVTKLKLQKCELSFTSLMDNKLPSLQELSLEDVCLNKMEVKTLLASCINIKSFTLKNCDGLKTLEIVGLSKLEKVDVEHGDDVKVIKIDAPNLLEFRYMYTDGESSCNTCCMEVEDCKSLKHLELNCSHLDDNDLEVLLEKSPFLEKLFLQNCDNLGYAEIYCQHLVNLVFHNCRELVRVRASTPNLKFFTYMGEDPISFMSKGPALKLTHASLSLKPDFRNDKWFNGLIKLLAKLSHTESLTIEVASDKYVIIPESVKTKSSPPLHAVKNLRVEFRLSGLKSPVEVVESLLWLAPCPESISISRDDCSGCKSIKFLYEKPLKGKKKCGCWKSSINCWRHSLKTVWIENQGSAKDDTKLVNFFEKRRIDGKIECITKNVMSKYGYGYGSGSGSESECEFGYGSEAEY
ncbi:FBD-associated F-box protein At1g66310 [Spinacia oleracea]|uniref:FBD-associated F-box protein At1g66310 n=1 Tax=Spinacia oleracea TaxID=3562 RepID=A0A9R0ING2_SPIOL|nr:FBD-associated F-box protein At1g66310-like [Spinacia oleracea]